MRLVGRNAWILPLLATAPASGFQIVASRLELARASATGVLSSPRRVSALYAVAFVALAIVHLQSLNAIYPPSGVSIPAWDSRQSNLWILAPQAVILTFLFAVYLLVLLSWGSLRFSPRQVLGMGLFAGATAALALPANSWDVFAYLGWGRISAIHGLNPYLTGYAQIADSYSPYAWYRGPMNHGPVVLSAFLAAGLTSEYSPLAAVYVLKVQWLVVHLCAAWALGHVLKEARLDPGYGLFLFTLNPLVLFELILNGHNDGLMILFAILALAALQRGHGGAALLIALLGALVKAPGAVLYATTAVYLIRQRHWRSLASGVAGTILITVGVILLFFPDVRSALVLLDRPGVSLYAGIVNVMTGGDSVPQDVMLRGGLQLVLMLALALFAVWRLAKIADFEGVVRETSYLMLATLVALQGSIYPWYVTWVFPFVVFLGSARTRYVVLLYSWTVLGLYYLYPPYAPRLAALFEGSFFGRQLRRVLVYGVFLGLLVGPRRAGHAPAASLLASLPSGR
jgi:hypothetical protein